MEHKALDTVLSFLVGRRLSTKEICAALEIGRTTYYEQREDGRLISADNLVRAARNLGLNPVDLLVSYGHISSSSAVDYADEIAETPRRRRARRGVALRGMESDPDAPQL
jgi:hypothetical protein